MNKLAMHKNLFNIMGIICNNYIFARMYLSVCQIIHPAYIINIGFLINRIFSDIFISDTPKCVTIFNLNTGIIFIKWTIIRIICKNMDTAPKDDE